MDDALQRLASIKAESQITMEQIETVRFPAADRRQAAKGHAYAPAAIESWLTQLGLSAEKMWQDLEDLVTSLSGQASTPSLDVTTLQPAVSAAPVFDAPPPEAPPLAPMPVTAPQAPTPHLSSAVSPSNERAVMSEVLLRAHERADQMIQDAQAEAEAIIADARARVEQGMARATSRINELREAAARIEAESISRAEKAARETEAFYVSRITTLKERYAETCAAIGSHLTVLSSALHTTDDLKAVLDLESPALSQRSIASASPDQAGELFWGSLASPDQPDDLVESSVETIAPAEDIPSRPAASAEDFAPADVSAWDMDEFDAPGPASDSTTQTNSLRQYVTSLGAVPPPDGLSEAG